MKNENIVQMVNDGIILQKNVNQKMAINQKIKPSVSRD